MNKDSEHIDEKLLLRFLLGEANKKEIQEVDEWLQLSEENQKILDNYEAVWAEAGKLTPNPVAVDTSLAWAKMSDKVDQYEKEKAADKSRTISLNSRLAWISTSAAAILIVIFGIYQLLKKPDIAVQNVLLASVENVLHDTLPDGSQIALNTNSQITYPEQFSENERRVILEGEAFFNVEHNPEQPFIIEAGDAFIKVLGTSFNIKAYENSELEVIVTDGLVQLFTVDTETMDTSAILLKAGEKGKISFKERKPVFVSEQLPDELFWMNSRGES